MKVIGVRWVLSTAVVATFVVTAGRSDGGDRGVQAKLEYCETCHGLSGEGYHGYFTMPRLAGQQPRYIENQLRAFIERRRTNPVMANVAHVLTPSVVSGLAAHFESLDPPPIGGAPRHSLALGKEIF